MGFERNQKRIKNAVQFLEPWMMALGFGYLGLYATEVLAEPTGPALTAVRVAMEIVYWIFIADLAARVLADLNTFRTVSGWVAFLKLNWLSIVTVIVPAFRTLRVLRVLIVLRGIVPYLVSRSAKVGLFVGVSFPLVLVTSALAVLEAERYAEGASITTFADALWWSLVSVTTVGYGDSYPVTSDGRAVAALLMFVGIGLFSSLTALLAAWVVGGRSHHEEQER